MIELVISILILAAAAMAVSPLFKNSKYLVRLKSDGLQDSDPYNRKKLENLNCRVRLTTQENDDSVMDSFAVEICGTIYAPDGCDRAVANISITDVTDGTQKAKPVYSLVEKWRVKRSQIFCCTANLGRLPSQVTTLSAWMTVAKIPADCLALPHKGKRNLQFRVAILSGQNGAQLACAAYGFIYENPALGYIELDDNVRRAKTMAVPLAFAVAAADRKMAAREIEVIQKWSKGNITAPQADKITSKLRNLLGWTIAFFPHCNRIYTYNICKKIRNTVPVKVRCDILELCLRVVAASGTIENEQLVLLKNMADCFGINREKFRAMAESVLTVSLCEVEDLEISLGIASDMSKDQLCRQLSKEYRKWNARVINRNPEIENQAEHMLKLIADLRNQYVG